MVAMNIPDVHRDQMTPNTEQLIQPSIVVVIDILIKAHLNK